jgi:hypothetical protein
MLIPEMVQTNEPFSQRFVVVITVRDSTIVHSRDYTNPVTAAQLPGNLPELVLSQLDATLHQ